MIIDVFIHESFSTVQVYDLSYTHLNYAFYQLISRTLHVLYMYFVSMYRMVYIKIQDTRKQSSSCLDNMYLLRHFFPFFTDLTCFMQKSATSKQIRYKCFRQALNIISIFSCYIAHCILSQRKHTCICKFF